MSVKIHYLTVKGTLWIALPYTVYRTSLDQLDPIILLFTEISTARCTLIRKLIPPANSKTAITLRTSLNTLTRKLSLVFSSSWNTTKKQDVKANQEDNHALLSQSFFGILNLHHILSEIVVLGKYKINRKRITFQTMLTILFTERKQLLIV